MTPAQYTVLVLVVSASFIILGLVMIVVATRALNAPSEKHELVLAVGCHGLKSLGIGLAIALAYCLFLSIQELKSRPDSESAESGEARKDVCAYAEVTDKNADYSNEARTAAKLVPSMFSE